LGIWKVNCEDDLWEWKRSAMMNILIGSGVDRIDCSIFGILVVGDP
jgi:hypothetical protein